MYTSSSSDHGTTPPSRETAYFARHAASLTRLSRNMDWSSA